MKCLVLGGGGFIGAPLSLSLAAAGHDVSVFDRAFPPALEPAAAAGRLEFIAGDFLDHSAVRAALRGVERVFHLVWTTLPQTSNVDPLFDVSSNVAGTLNLLNAARESGVRRIIFTSSGGTVYGVPITVPISENHPTQPISSYGITKLCAEKYLHLYHALHGLDYRILRIANPYGEGQRPVGAQGVIAAFLYKALKHESVEIWGDGSVVRDFLHVSDAVAGVLAASDYAGTEKIFNLGSGTGLSIQQLINHIETIMQEPLQIVRLPARAFDVPKVVLDITRASEHLQWSPGISFESGLTATLEWMKRTQL